MLTDWAQEMFLSYSYVKIRAVGQGMINPIHCLHPPTPLYLGKPQSQIGYAVAMAPVLECLYYFSFWLVNIVSQSSSWGGNVGQLVRLCNTLSRQKYLISFWMDWYKIVYRHSWFQDDELLWFWWSCNFSCCGTMRFAFVFLSEMSQQLMHELCVDICAHIRVLFSRMNCYDWWCGDGNCHPALLSVQNFSLSYTLVYDPKLQN